MKNDPLETSIEQKFVRIVEADGHLALKVNVAGRRGWPDRLVLLIAGQSFFIEFKRKGKKPRKLQTFIHDKLEALGYVIYRSVDTIEEAAKIYREEKARAEEFYEAISRAQADKATQLSKKEH